ncbi:MAG: hypothetical protein ACHQFX_00435 [Chitinophagales bacterium]
MICSAQEDTTLVKKQKGFLFLSSYNYLYDYDGVHARPVGFHDFFYPVNYFNLRMLEDSNISIVFKNGIRVNFLNNRNQLKAKAKKMQCADTSHCYEYDKFYIIPVVIDYKYFSDNWPLICGRNFYEVQVPKGSKARFEYLHKALMPMNIKVETDLK